LSNGGNLVCRLDLPVLQLGRIGWELVDDGWGFVKLHGVRNAVRLRSTCGSDRLYPPSEAFWKEMDSTGSFFP